MNLLQFENNIQSQYGEDGVIEEIFNRIGYKNKICVEFGAWDGQYLSNSWNLWHNKDWSAYLIEGDQKRAEELKENLKDFPKATSIHSFVMPEGESSLDRILSKYDVPKDFDMLSIDIDGDDYHVFAKLTNYRPRLVIIEFNPTIPPGIELIQDLGEYIGASSLSLIKLAEQKNYIPVHITQTNLFFIAKEANPQELFDQFNIDLQYKNQHLVNVITAFDGTSFLTQALPYKEQLPSRKFNLKTFIKSFLKKPEKISAPKFSSNQPIVPIDIFKNEDIN
jgi:hypothetical protein